MASRNELIELGFSLVKQRVRALCNITLPYVIIVGGIASTIVSSFIKVDDLKANTVINNYLNVTTENGNQTYNTTNNLSSLENLFTLGTTDTQIILIKAFSYINLFMGFMMIAQKWLNDKKDEVVTRKVTILETEKETYKEQLTTFTNAGLTRQQSLTAFVDINGSQLLSPLERDTRLNTGRDSTSTDYPRPFEYTTTNNEPV